MKLISPVPLQKLAWLVMLVLLDCKYAALGDENLPEGEGCSMAEYRGTCQTFANCPSLKEAYDNGNFKARDAVHCGFTVTEELICCPDRF